MKESSQENLIVKLTLEFAIEIILYAERLEAERKYVLANQILKSGTSIDANVREAQNAESKADFVHKFKIAAKEIEETEYWLLLCTNVPSYPEPENLQDKLKIIKKIISKIIISSKSK